EAQRRDGRAPDASRDLEREDQVEADDDDDGHGDRSRLDERQVEDVEREAVARQDAEACGGARREREPRQLAQESARAEAAGARRERQEEAGYADGERRRKRELPRQERIGGGSEPDRQDEEGGERGLRHEQLRDALDVA